MIAADAPRRDDHGLGRELERALDDTRALLATADQARLEHRPADAGHRSVRHDQLVDAVPEAERDEAARDRLPHAALERLDDAGSRPPREVEARHGVPVPRCRPVAALGPADDREDPMPHLAEPGALLAAREVDVRLRPALRPVILLAVEARAPEPVLPGELVGVADPQPPLLRRPDHEEAAERPERLPAERRLGLLLEQDDALPGVRELCRRDQPGKPRPDDHDVRVHHAIL